MPNRSGTRLLEVNWNHTISRGLLDCFVFNQGGQFGKVNLASPAAPPTFSAFTPGGWKGTSDGPGLAVPTDNTVSHPYYSFAERNLNDLTIRIRLVPVSFPNGFNAILANPGNVERFYVDASGNINFTAFAGNPFATSQTTGWAAGATGELTMVRNFGAASTDFYINGRFSMTGSPMGGSIAASNGPFALGRDPANAGNSGNFIFTSVQVWNRLLTSAEVRQLWFDPECFLSPVSGNLVVDPFIVAFPVPPPTTVLFAQACM